MSTVERGDAPAPAFLALELEPADLPFYRLIRAEEIFLSLVREVAGAVVERGDPVRWIVDRVEAGSLVIRVRLDPAENVKPVAMHRVAEAVADGAVRLEQAAERPPFFTDEALARARELAQFRGDDLPGIALRNGHDRAPVTDRMIENVDKVLGPDLLSIGTIEGRLESVTVHNRRAFNVYDDLTGQRIECHFGRRIEVEAIAAAVEKRVGVTGELRYRRSGELVGVRAHELEVFHDQSEIPSADDIRRMLRE